MTNFDNLIEMVHIPAGEFLMGAVEGEDRVRSNEFPQHSVTVPEFFLGKYPVTQTQWYAVATELPRIAYDLDPDPSEFKGDTHPVERVNWYETVEFCQRLSQATGRDYRLPSEAEWEYACRAGTTTPFHFGDVITPDLANSNYGEYREQTTPVGSFPANGFGLYDMHGNVWEWCADDWHDTYEGAPTDGTAWPESNNRWRVGVLRGGSWSHYPRDCRSANRNWFTPYFRLNNIGFRVCCSVTQKEDFDDRLQQSN